MNELKNNDGNKVESVTNKVAKKPRTINGIDEKLFDRVVAKVGYPKRGKIRINTTMAMKLKTAGFSYKQIGSFMGVSGCTIKRRLKEAGLI